MRADAATAAPAATGAAGRLAGRTHVLPLRVYYEDTDAGGIVYYANYLRFAERGRTEYLRDVAPAEAAALAAQGAAFAVRHCTADYQKPAHLDDALTVHTAITEIGGASLVAEQQVRRDDDLLVALTVRLVCIDARGRPLRLPAALRQVLEGAITSPPVSF